MTDDVYKELEIGAMESLDDSAVMELESLK